MIWSHHAEMFGIATETGNLATLVRGRSDRTRRIMYFILIRLGAGFRAHANDGR